MHAKILLIAGPTASGKTSLAVSVAQTLQTEGIGAEIVNADSMLVYRGMDIGTAKPTEAERGQIRHHLIDIFDVTQTASVAEFQRLARSAISDCQQRGVLPIVVGGSALYLRAIVDDFDFPATDPHLRQQLETELETVGPMIMYQRLQSKDPLAAEGILATNGRRIVRALEVIELTGSYRSTLPPWTYLLPGVAQIGLEIPRDELDQRISQRVTTMWEQGFVAEVETLVDQGLKRGVTASRGLGYQQILAAIDGQISFDQAKEQTIVATKKFARKQLSWFRRDPRITWFSYQAPNLIEAAANLAKINCHPQQ